MKKYRTAILYGVVVATSGTILMLSLIFLGLLGPKAISSEREMIGGTILFLMLYLLLLIGIYFILQNKKEQNNNRLNFKAALVHGTTLSMTTAVVSVVFTYFFYEVLYPDHVNDLLTAMREKMELIGIPQDKIEEKLNEKASYYSTFVQASYSFIGNLITGLAFTFLLSFFLKTNK